MPRGCRVGTTVLRQEFVRCVHGPMLERYAAEVRRNLQLTEADFVEGGKRYESGDKALRGMLALVVSVGMSTIGAVVGAVRLVIGALTVTIAWRRGAAAMHKAAAFQWALLLVLCLASFAVATQVAPPRVESIGRSVIA